MRFSWWWKRPVAPDRDAARDAVRRAERSVHQAEGRREVVADLTRKLTHEGLQNNFIERLNMHVNRGGGGR